MLIDELRLQLKEIEPDLELIKTFYEKTNIDQQYKELDEIVHAENFWQNQNQIDLSKKYQRAKALSEEYHNIITSYNDNGELIELFADNEAELISSKQEIKFLCKKIKYFKLSLLMSEESDSK